MKNKTLRVVIAILSIMAILYGLAMIREVLIEIGGEPVETAVETPVEAPVADEEKAEEIVEDPGEEKAEEIVEETPEDAPIKTFSIINMTGKSLKDAESALSAFKLKVTEQFSDSVENGLVISQNPKSGEKEKGVEVEVRVSLGKKPVAVVPKPTPAPTTPIPSTPKPSPTPTPAPKPSPVVLVGEEIKFEEIAFTTKETEDNTLEEGQTKVVQNGVNGVKTLKYQVTTTDGKETARKLISEEVTKQPITKIIANGTKKIETWNDRVERQAPAGFTLDFTPTGAIILRNGEMVGSVGVNGLNMNINLGRDNHESLADFWINFRKEFGAATNRSDLFTALNSYYENGQFGVTGKIDLNYGATKISLTHN